MDELNADAGGGTEARAAAAGSAFESNHPAGVLLRGISKRFGEVIANESVDLELVPGEVHALLGENGAGKTTLMNILCGLIRPDEGEILIGNEPVVIRSPRHAGHLGIGMVHQHFRLIDRMTVAENLALGWSECPEFGGQRTLVRLARDVMSRYGFDIDPSVRIAELSVAEQQRVEIVRTLGRGARVLILDEPTAVLTPQEADQLGEVIRSVVAEGKTVVFISHKLREVLAVADRVSVMRAGRLVKTLDAAVCEERMLARLMIGRDLSRQPRRDHGRSTRTVLAVRSLSVMNDRRLLALRDVDLDVGEGEILGVAGVAGNGQRELAEALTGLRKATAGTIAVDGLDLTNRGSRTFIDAGVGHVPEDRNGTGLAPSEAIWRNAVLKQYRRPHISSRFRFRSRAAKSAARELCRSVRLSTDDIDTPVRHLSGGNAQRLLTGREIQTATRVLVAVHPTRGVDVAGAEAVHDALTGAQSSGLAIVLISEDLDELLELSDRLVVLYEGRIVGEFRGGEVHEETLGLLMGTGQAESLA